MNAPEKLFKSAAEILVDRLPQFDTTHGFYWRDIIKETLPNEKSVVVNKKVAVKWIIDNFEAIGWYLDGGCFVATSNPFQHPKKFMYEFIVHLSKMILCRIQTLATYENKKVSADDGELILNKMIDEITFAYIDV